MNWPTDNRRKPLRGKVCDPWTQSVDRTGGPRAAHGFVSSRTHDVYCYSYSYGYSYDQGDNIGYGFGCA